MVVPTVVYVVDILLGSMTAIPPLVFPRRCIRAYLGSYGTVGGIFGLIAVFRAR